MNTFLRAMRWSLRKALSDWNMSHTASFLLASSPGFSSAVSGKVKLAVARGEMVREGLPGLLGITLQRLIDSVGWNEKTLAQRGF